MDEIKIEVPAEPPNFSVVLDADGFAWQRLAGVWVRNGAVLGLLGVSGTHMSWSQLLVNRGSVRVIYWAPVKETA